MIRPEIIPFRKAIENGQLPLIIREMEKDPTAKGILLPLVNIAKAQMSHLEFMRFCWGRNRKMEIGIHTWYTCHEIDKAFDNFRKGISTFLITLICFRHGKLISNDTPVFTPEGWKLHGDLKIGDKVFNDSGKEVRITGVTPEDYADNEVEFSDGTIVKCHDNHEWIVMDAFKKFSRVKLSTKNMLGKVRYGRLNRPRFMTYHNRILEMKEKKLPIHPYVFGVWLGNGSKDKNCITHDKKDIAVIEKIQQLGYEEKTVCIHNKTGVHTTYFKKLYGDLVRDKFLGNKKHIPTEYLTGSVEQRLELLAGLIDTDGYVDKTGRICFSNTNEDILFGVRTLINSLGSRYSMSRYEPRLSSSGIQGKLPVYQIRFCPILEIPTALERKKVNKLSKSDRLRSIKSIRKCDPVKGKCIQVEGGEYLVGKTNVLTHNSEMTTRYLPPHFLAEFPDRNSIVTSHSTKKTNEFSRFGRALVRSDKFKELYPDIKISEENAGIEEWGLEGYEGLSQYYGILSGSAGTGGALIVTDDFFGGREDAESQVMRDKVDEAYTNNIFTRRDDPSINMITVTPWNKDDLVGRLEKRMITDNTSTRYNIVRLPYKEPDDVTIEAIKLALEEEKDLELKEDMSKELEIYSNGGYLFSKKYSNQWYIDMENSLGGANGYGTSSLMRCSPTLKTGARFKTENVRILEDEEFNSKSKGLAFIRCYDLASSVKQINKTDPDYTVGIKMAVRFLPTSVKGLTIAEIYVSHLMRGRWEAPARNQKIIDTAISDGLIKIFVETYGQYKDAYDELKRLLRGIRVIKGIRCPGDKHIKSECLEPIFEAGNVYLLRGDWNNKLIAEFTEETSHDDIIDAMVIGYKAYSPVKTGFAYEESLVV